MTTITREQLRERAREKVKSLEFAVTQTAFAENRAELEEELELARIALASLEAEPVAYLNATDIKNSEDHILAKRLRSHACTMPVYTATPAPVVPDANGCLPCPFCNSPVKWCGENSADPDDDHICHHIQCTNPECGADFDFINTGDDLLPDDPAVLDAMTSAELVQPLREVCKGRFNLRAAMLQGSQPVSNRDELPDIVGWIRSDYHSDRRMGDAPIFILGCVDPSDVWGVKYIPLTGNSPVIPDDVLSAVRKVARIRADFDDFDGDRRGIGDCLDEAEQDLIVTINKHDSVIAAAPQQEVK
ncbi:Lar family restriction alleviation protein [Citrobacter amalonaticus]|uniref:Lar family restriction alleviation protein n=1 Tax=Citrobacter amalonaticus TaxID=35703 RepID=UPI0020A2E4D1|nr:Lar family restriction alleviation protein [Citrobacter amalonaticus]